MTRIVVVMGVSGSGKTTLAERLAAHLGARFIEGDSFHPAANIARMAAGRPLTDAMRRPWLVAVGRAAAAERAGGRDVVVTCSALKRSYRDLLRAEAGPLTFLFLDGPAEVIAGRLARRQGHYMPASLLASQIATLERPGESEADVATVPLTAGRDAALARALSALDSADPAG